MQPLPEQDVALLQSLTEDDIPLPLLLRWIDPRNHGCLPPDLLSDPTSLGTENMPLTPEKSTCPEESHAWKSKLDSTSRQSFALSFLQYMRAQLQPFFAVADGNLANDLHKSANKENRGPLSPGLEKKSGQQRSQKHATTRKNVGERDDALEQRKIGPGQVYEDEFPALAPLSVQNTAPKTKQRRRVTPTQTEDIVVDSAFVLAKVEPSTVKQGQRKGRRFEPRNLEVDMDMLMQRGDANRKQKHTEKKQHAFEDNEPVNQLGCVGRVGSARSESLFLTTMANLETSAAASEGQIVLHHGSQSAGTATSSNSLPEIQLPGPAPQHPADCAVDPPSSLLRVSSVHAALMVARMVPSLLAELQFLVQLLTLPATSYNNEADAGDIRLFHDSNDCSGYACLVLQQAGRLIECVGEYFLSALVDEPAISRHSPQLLARIKAALADQQGASLRSDKAYETAGASHSSPSTSMQAPTVPRLLVSVPFQSARDSRHNFKTPEEIKVYNNREQCRDLFYSIVREAAAAYSTFGPGAHESEHEGFSKMKESANQFLKVLLTENYPWFAEFFLEQVLQVYLCGDADPLIAGLARQDQVKLQKLHDRLSTTSTSSTDRQQKQVALGDGRLDLSPSSPWSQVKTTQSVRPANKRANTSSRNLFVMNKAVHVKDRLDIQEASESRFSSFFPQFLRVYIWFLEVTDSHRFNTHLIWSIKYKIASLTELSPDSGDASYFGSGFTQRVLALKAIAGLLGFFSFSPGAGTLPPVPVVSGAWPVLRIELPVDVEGLLSIAKKKGLVLLVLPWVLEFLRLSKADAQAHCQPFFHSSLSALRDLYLLPMLDPFHTDFGIGSLCILAELDSFFEYMELPVNVDPAVSQNDPAFPGNGIRADQSGDEGYIGLDKVPGIVDTRYILHCCRMLVEIRLELLEGKRRRQRGLMHTRSPGPGRQLRKITPVPKRCEWQLECLSPVLRGKKNASNNNKPETLKLNLQRSFLEQRPQLRRLVDFLVDTVAVNAGSAAVSKFVPQVVRDAFEKLDSDSSFMLERSAGNGPDPTPRISSCLEITAEQIISSAIREAISSAEEFLQLLTAEKISQALSILVCPSEIVTAVGVAAGIAAEAAGVSAQQKALARMSTEIRRQITEEVHRRVGQPTQMEQKAKLRPSHMGPSTHYTASEHQESNKSQTEVAGSGLSGLKTELESHTGRGISPHHVATEAARQENSSSAESTLDRATKFAGTVKRQLAFSGRNTYPPDADVNASMSSCVEREHLLAGKIVKACSAAHGFLASGLYTDERRNQMRHHLSVMCLSIEALLSQVGGIPSGGVDGLVTERNGRTLLRKLSSIMDTGLQQVQGFSTPGKTKGSSSTHFRVELGLTRRSVALALRLCFTSPYLAFGLKSGTEIPECFCDSIVEKNLCKVHSLYNVPLELLHTEVDERRLPSFSPPNVRKNHLSNLQWCSLPTKSSANVYTGCQQALWYKQHLAGPMLGLVTVWKGMVNQEICSVKFLIGELLAPWRWSLALYLDPWEIRKPGLEAPKNGLIGVLLHIIHGSSGVDEVQEPVSYFMKTMCGEVESANVEHQVRVDGKILAVAVGLHALMGAQFQTAITS